MVGSNDQRTVLPNNRVPGGQLLCSYRRSLDVMGYWSGRKRLHSRIPGYLLVHRFLLSRLHPTRLVLDAKLANYR